MTKIFTINHFSLKI